MRINLLKQDWRSIAPVAKALSSRKGMTLVEVMVVIVIVLMLTGVLAWGVMGMFGEGKIGMSELMVTKAAQRVEVYGMRKKIPNDLGKIFGDEVPEDAWGNKLVLVTPGSNGKDFDLISYGPDGQEGGGDDIKSSGLGQ